MTTPRPASEAEETARDLIAAVNKAMSPALPTAIVDTKPQPTFYRDPTPIPAVGDAPPVTQPGRPPMSAAATNLSGIMLASGVPILALGAAATGILWASGTADPTVVAMICAAPAGLAIPILALSRLVKRTKEAVQAAPPVIHQHYTGTVHQEQHHTTTSTRGVWAKTRNELPR